MKLPSEVIPKFIISLDKNKERQDYLKKEVYPKLTNYFKCAAFDAELDDANEILKENNIFLTDTFYDKCSEGQLGCFLSHFQLWKYIIKSNIDLAIVLEDDVKIYNNFNKNIDTIYENLPVKFDYVHLFIHPDKQNIQYLEGKDGDIIPAEDNFGTVAYMISLRGAKRLVKLTELLKIQAPVDRQINFCIQHNFIKAFMIKKPFLLTQGEIMPNRAIYENSFKSTIWYSKKLKDAKRVREEFIKLAGFTDEDVERIDQELLASKQKVEEPKVVEDPIIIKKIEIDTSIDLLEKEKEQESEEEQILNSVITRLNEI
jgi:GR25 family glycosyltransferase involved in LPS biosynthesis